MHLLTGAISWQEVSSSIHTELDQRLAVASPVLLETLELSMAATRRLRGVNSLFVGAQGLYTAGLRKMALAGLQEVSIAQSLHSKEAKQPATLQLCLTPFMIKESFD